MTFETAAYSAAVLFVAYLVRGIAGFGSGLIAAAYDLPSSCRAGSVVRISNAGVGSRLTP